MGKKTRIAKTRHNRKTTPKKQKKVNISTVWSFIPIISILILLLLTAIVLVFLKPDSQSTSYIRTAETPVTDNENQSPDSLGEDNLSSQADKDQSNQTDSSPNNNTGGSNSSGNSGNAGNVSNSNGAGNAGDNKPNNSSASGQSSNQTGVSTINPSDIVGHWRLDGAQYAYLIFNGNKWDGVHMTVRGGRFITYETDGWVSNIGQTNGLSSDVGKTFNKNDGKNSILFLQKNYGLRYANSKLYFSFGGNSYSFTKTSGSIRTQIWFRFKELSVSYPKTELAESNLCISPGSARYLTVDKESIPYPVKVFDTYSFGTNKLLIEFTGKNNNGDYQFRFTSFEGDDPNYLVFFPGLRLRISNANNNCHE